MSDFDPRPDFERREAMAAVASDTTLRTDRPGYIRRGQPFFTPLDAAAYVVIILMICGPLAVGALHS
jgi:hypothetical protein